MKENIEKLDKHHSEFNFIWNEYGRETQREISDTTHGRLLLKKLSAWYVRGKDIITDMEEEHGRI